MVGAGTVGVGHRSSPEGRQKDRGLRVHWQDLISVVPSGNECQRAPVLLLQNGTGRFPGALDRGRVARLEWRMVMKDGTGVEWGPGNVDRKDVGTGGE